MQSLTSAFGPDLAKHYLVRKAEVGEGIARYTLECLHEPRRCPRCGASLRPWGAKERLVSDIPHEGRRIEFLISAKRYRCTGSDRGEASEHSHPSTFLQELPGVPHHRSMTQRLLLWIAEQCRHRTFTDVARSIGIAEATVRSVFAEHVQRHEAMVRLAPAPSMALVPVRVLGKKVMAFLNVHAHTLLDLAPGLRQEQLEEALSVVSRESSPERVNIPPVNEARSAVRKLAPKASLLVDRAYVEEAANAALCAVLRSLPRWRKAKTRGCDLELLFKPITELTPDGKAAVLDCLGSAAPELRHAYTVRWTLHELYTTNKTTRAKAHQTLSDVREWLADPCASQLAQLATLLDCWAEEIAAYFLPDAELVRLDALGDLSRLSDVIEAKGRGRSFEAVRTAILFPDSVPVTPYRSMGVSLVKLLRDHPASITNTRL